MSATDLYRTEACEPSRRVLAEIDCAFIQDYRRRARESQKRFWARFGVTQSRGSRFELGSAIPKPVMILLGLYFAEIISDVDIVSVSQRSAPARHPVEINPG
jgi:hypothetical protein